ncbi:hypothetical protein V2J09_020791 [Rumex salicifolius]
MLLSPGHSPRHLSSPSPSASSDPSASSSSIVPTTAKGTPISSKKKATVLDEDTYVATIEKIIERDYFPDIPKLRDRLDWLEAVRSGDPLQIRDAQLKIMERRQGKGSNADSQGKFPTPGSTFFRDSATPFQFEKSPAGTGNDLAGKAPEGEGDGVDASVSLDKFFRQYTSEDNESFTKIIEKVNRKRKERYGYLLEGEKEEDVLTIEDVKRDRITDGYGTSYQPPSTLEGCKFVAKNLLMYHPADRGEVPLTDEEMAERLKGLTKEISKPNTRFHGNMWSSSKNDESVDIVYAPVAGATPLPLNLADREMDKSRRYDLEDLRKTPTKFYVESEKKAKNGYNYVKTPSPAPGVDESPIITWGEIEGTPLRLDPEDTPFDIGGSSDGPHFKIPNMPTRDVKAHSLSREAARNLKERSRMFQKPPLPSPVRSGSASPNVRTLSHAAQKFVRKAIAKSSNPVDESLRASYRSSSPSVNTPKSAARSESRLGKTGSPLPRFDNHEKPDRVYPNET